MRRNKPRAKLLIDPIPHSNVDRERMGRRIVMVRDTVSERASFERSVMLHRFNDAPAERGKLRVELLNDGLLDAVIPMEIKISHLCRLPP